MIANENRVLVLDRSLRTINKVKMPKHIGKNMLSVVFYSPKNIMLLNKTSLWRYANKTGKWKMMRTFQEPILASEVIQSDAPVLVAATEKQLFQIDIKEADIIARRLPKSLNSPRMVRLSLDKNYVASLSYGLVDKFTIQNVQLSRTVEHSMGRRKIMERVSAFTITENGKLIIGRRNGVIEKIGSLPNQSEGVLRTGAEVTYVRETKTGKLIYGLADGRFEVTSIKNSDMKDKKSRSKSARDGYFRILCAFRSNNIVAVSHEGEYHTLTSSGKCLCKRKLFNTGISSAYYLDSKGLVAFGSNLGHVSIVDINKCKTVATMRVCEKKVVGIRKNDNRSVLVAICKHGTTTAIDMRSKKILRSRIISERTLHALAYNKHRNHYIAVGEYEIVFLSVDLQVLSRKRYEDSIQSNHVFFSKDGDFFYLVYDGTTVVRHKLKSTETKSRHMLHKDIITSIRSTAGGSRIITSAFDGSMITLRTSDLGIMRKNKLNWGPILDSCVNQKRHVVYTLHTNSDIIAWSQESFTGVAPRSTSP